MGKIFLLIGIDPGWNYGIDAIVLGTERILHKRFPDGAIWLSPPGWKRKKYRHIFRQFQGIDVKDQWGDGRFSYFTRRILEKSRLLSPEIVRVQKNLVKRADCVLSIGGDLYTFAGHEKNWPFPYSIMEAGNAIIDQDIPYVIWCASVGPFEKAGSRFGELKDHLKRCHAIFVRERESFSYLQQIIGLKDNVYLAADPAFVMEPEPFEADFLCPPKGEKVIAINFSLAPMEHVFGHVSMNALIENLICFVRRLLNTFSARLVFVPHVSRDHEFLSYLLSEISRQYSERVWILPEDTGSKKTKWVISQSSALITMRFHCALAGFSTHTPTIILISTSKGEKICKEMYGDLEYSMDLRNFDVELLLQKLGYLFEHEKAIRERLESVSEEMKKRAYGAGDILARVLE